MILHKIHFRFTYLTFSLLMFGSLFSCEHKKLENGKAIADEVERRTVKRFTEKQIQAEALQIGNSITHRADSLLYTHLLKNLESGGVAAALQQYPPEEYPAVQTLASKYAAVPQRKQHRSANPTTAQVQVLSQTELLYTKPIYLDETTCSPCHGKNTVKAADLDLIKKKFPHFQPTGLKQDDQLGYWYIPIKRKGILERLTLKR